MRCRERRVRRCSGLQAIGLLGAVDVSLDRGDIGLREDTRPNRHFSAGRPLCPVVENTPPLASPRRACSLHKSTHVSGVSASTPCLAGTIGFEQVDRARSRPYPAAAPSPAAECPKWGGDPALVSAVLGRGNADCRPSITSPGDFSKVFFTLRLYARGRGTIAYRMSGNKKSYMHCNGLSALSPLFGILKVCRPNN